ncbi:hypothetical protein RH831_11250 [Halodesulfurarchaeum sp. HSR-GB]|uniref:hypothetical protein n=1 Tax=Halodesulfurarchaeum sp. HSR-GB TaxID=3074077 RepID=UPI002855DEC0|nr:hypothetical protein [Halodesulfurarchaeum sp. HSR-GB]MDR5657751.1 hypothetical protein [Halodesulfurarchaeum sp. HSR-GB]
MNPPNDGGDNDPTQGSEPSTNDSSRSSFWEDPPEWAEKLNEEGAEVVPVGGSQSEALAYITLRKNNEIGISQRAMYEHFDGVNTVAIGVQSPSGGGAKKLYLIPIDDDEDVPFAADVRVSDSGSGAIRVGKPYEHFDLQPEEAERYSVKRDEDLNAVVANLNTSPLNN